MQVIKISNHKIINRKQNLSIFIFWSLINFQIIFAIMILRTSHQIQQNFDRMDLDWLWLIIPGAYIVISLFFLCFPNILHKRQSYLFEMFNSLINSDKLICIGHRGGSYEGPENTLQLFRLNRFRCHMFELDVCFTKDQQLVVHHDLNLRRACGVDKLIINLNYKELPPFQQTYESYGGGPIKTTKNKIPLLQQLFKQFPNMPMNIELKTPSEQAIQQFNRLVKKYDRESFTIWGAMKQDFNQRMREVNPKVVCFFSIYQTFKIFLLCISGLLPFVCIRQGVLDLPLIGEQFEESYYSMANTNGKKCLVWLLIKMIKFFNLINRLFVPHFKKRGILTFYWIVNEQEGFQKAVSIGSSGIMTDRTEKLSQFLKRKYLDLLKQE